MTDQPPTNHSDHEPTSDQPADHHGVVDKQPPTDQDDTPALVSLEEAAAELGISVNAVRQRIKRNTVAAIKTETGWLVDMVATNQRQGTSRSTNQATKHSFDATDQQTTTDLTPLAEVIRDQNRRNEEQAQRIAELSAAVGMWQARAMHLEEQMQQLTATVEAPESTESDDQSDQAPEPEDVGISQAESFLERLRRWMIGR